MKFVRSSKAVQRTITPDTVYTLNFEGDAKFWQHLSVVTLLVFSKSSVQSNEES
jgi:hypothetical protein